MGVSSLFMCTDNYDMHLEADQKKEYISKDSKV